MSRNDFDSEEREFKRDIGGAVRAHREQAGACPTPDLLMAACSGVPFEGSVDVQRHMAICPICEQLSRDLAEYEFPAATDEEDGRIRARWQAARRTSSWPRIWRPLVVAAAFGLLVVGIFVVRSTRQSATLSSKEATQQIVPPASRVTPPASSPFTLAKAAIKIPAAAVLTFRGDANQSRTYLADLAAALEPYRKDDYAQAARTLAALSLKYPDAAEPAFYEGVSQLFLNQNEGAVEALQSARRHAGDTLRDDISWYLALACDRAGRTSDARREAEGLCMRAGEYKDRACAAAEQLESR